MSTQLGFDVVTWRYKHYEGGQDIGNIASNMSFQKLSFYRSLRKYLVWSEMNSVIVNNMKQQNIQYTCKHIKQLSFKNVHVVFYSQK